MFSFKHFFYLKLRLDLGKDKKVESFKDEKLLGRRTFKRLKSFLSKGENGRKKRKRKKRKMLHTVTDRELMKRYKLDSAGIMFAVHLIRDVLTSLPQNNNTTMPEMKVITKI